MVIRELDEFLTAGSALTIVVDPEIADPGWVEGSLADGLTNSTAEVRALASGPEYLSDVLGDEAYDQAILLGYRPGMSHGDADARTLLTLMALRRRWPKGHPPEVRLVAEVLDQRNVHIAQMAGVDDFIVSDQLASLMIAQLSERAELREVFDELFDAVGASVVLRPAGRFCPLGSGHVRRDRRGGQPLQRIGARVPDGGRRRGRAESRQVGVDHPPARRRSRGRRHPFRLIAGPRSGSEPG